MPGMRRTRSTSRSSCPPWSPPGTSPNASPGRTPACGRGRRARGKGTSAAYGSILSYAGRRSSEAPCSAPAATGDGCGHQPAHSCSGPPSAQGPSHITMVVRADRRSGPGVCSQTGRCPWTTRGDDSLVVLPRLGVRVRRPLRKVTAACAHIRAAALGSNQGAGAVHTRP